MTQREHVAFVALSGGGQGRRDTLGVVDLRGPSDSYGELIGRLELPAVADGITRYTMARLGPGPADREILMSGSSSRILPVPWDDRAGAGHGENGRARGMLVSALDPWAAVAVVDSHSLEVTAHQAVRHENVVAGFDVWASSEHGVVVSSEGCDPGLLARGVDWDSLLRGEYGHRLVIRHLDEGIPSVTIDLGVEHQMVLRVVGAHRSVGDCYGFASVLASSRTLASSVWCWYRARGRWSAEKVIEIPPEVCPAGFRPDALDPVGVVPPLVTDIKLSPDNRFLYASCWGTGELLQYEVTDPLRPRLTGTVRLGGIVQRSGHPRRPVMDGGPQALAVSADGLRIYVANSASGRLDRQFYPDKTGGWLVKFDTLPHGGLTLDSEFLVPFEEGLPQDILLSDRALAVA